jgi:hypothetical protein
MLLAAIVAFTILRRMDYAEDSAEPAPVAA